MLSLINELYEAKKIQNLSIIINHVDLKSGYNYGYNYGYGYNNSDVKKNSILRNFRDMF